MADDTRPDTVSDHKSSPQRARLLRALKRKTAPGIGQERNPGHARSPLSFAQEAFWLLHQMHEDDSGRKEESDQAERVNPLDGRRYSRRRAF